MAFNSAKREGDQLAAGKWEDFEGGRFKIAMAGNPVFHMAKQRLQKEYTEKHGESMSAPLEFEMFCRSIAEGLLRDWEGVEDINDAPIPYSIDAAALELQGSVALYEFVMTKALEYEKQYRSHVEKQAKKPQKSSDTS